MFSQTDSVLVEEIVSGLNTYYDYRRNLDVPIYQAYHEILNKLATQKGDDNAWL